MSNFQIYNNNMNGFVLQMRQTCTLGVSINESIACDSSPPSICISECVSQMWNELWNILSIRNKYKEKEEQEERS